MKTCLCCGRKRECEFFRCPTCGSLNPAILGHEFEKSKKINVMKDSVAMTAGELSRVYKSKCQCGKSNLVAYFFNKARTIIECDACGWADRSGSPIKPTPDTPYKICPDGNCNGVMYFSDDGHTMRCSVCDLVQYYNFADRQRISTYHIGMTGKTKHISTVVEGPCGNCGTRVVSYWVNGTCFLIECPHCHIISQGDGYNDIVVGGGAILVCQVCGGAVNRQLLTPDHAGLVARCSNCGQEKEYNFSFSKSAVLTATKFIERTLKVGKWLNNDTSVGLASYPFGERVCLSCGVTMIKGTAGLYQTIENGGGAFRLSKQTHKQMTYICNRCGGTRIENHKVGGVIEVAKCEIPTGMYQFEEIIPSVTGDPLAPKNMPCRQCGRVTTFHRIIDNKPGNPINIEYSCPYCGIHAIINIPTGKKGNAMANS